MIADYLSGNRQAGNALAERYYPALRTYFRTRVPTEEAEELAQHTLLHTVARSERFRHASSFRHYVYSVARRVLAERHRQALRRPDCDPEHETPADDTSPSERIVRLERHAALELALTELKSPFREVVRMHLDGMTNVEIAEALGIPSNTVRSRLSRALASLRRALANDEAA
nr:sigma-70 family RNA polymerase sigma factor [Pseudenhygromyxa sp. WMMC2535]